MQHFEAERIKLHSLPKSLLHLHSVVFDCAVLTLDMGFDFFHLFLELLDCVELLVRSSGRNLFENLEDSLVLVLQVENLNGHLAVILRILHHLLA